MKNHGESDKHPFTTALDEFIKQHGQIREDKSTNVKAKKFGRMPRAELHPNMRWRRVLQTGIFHLPRYLVCQAISE